MMVTTEVIVASVVFVLLCPVFAHLRGVRAGRREQEELFHREERIMRQEAAREDGDLIHRMRQDIERMEETALATRRLHAQAFKEKDAATTAILDAAEVKYRRMLEEASEELADANARIDFFWEYACKVTVSADNGPQIRLRTERQDREEFDHALTEILLVKFTTVRDPDD